MWTFDPCPSRHTSSGLKRYFVDPDTQRVACRVPVKKREYASSRCSSCRAKLRLPLLSRPLVTVARPVSQTVCHESGAFASEDNGQTRREVLDPEVEKVLV